MMVRKKDNINHFSSSAEEKFCSDQKKSSAHSKSTLSICNPNTGE